MARDLELSVHVEGMNETLAALHRLPRQADRALRERTLVMSQVLAARVGGAARGDGPQTALMAPTVRPVAGRTPGIVAGGTSRVGSRQVPAYKIIFGSEFGSGVYHQFRPHVGRGSYWLWHTVQRNEAMIVAAWAKAADDIVKSFEKGGG